MERWVAVGVLLANASIHAQAAEPRTTTRVRSDSPIVAAAIAEAIEYSPTFRAMVEDLGATDGLVYVRACVAGVHSAPPIRLVYIKVETRKAVGCELMASLGHELQHALEVLWNPKVVDNRSLAHFYLRAGPTGDDRRFETEAAVRAGLRVDNDLHARSRCKR
jgi:hypothetical protein